MTHLVLKNGSSNYGTSNLLRLPIELQLMIYELVVIQNEVLLLNCPCNSSYRGRYGQLRQDEEAWQNGEMRPPLQPSLTRTSRLIRRLALPIFYHENIFRASYCYQASMLPTPIEWLKRIGKENREMLRHLYFYDRNQNHDEYCPKDMETVKCCDIFTEMGGRIYTFSNENYCAHLVTFGEWKRNEDETPVAAPLGGKALKADGER